MALVQSNSADPRAFSNGPYKQQLIKFNVASGDTSGTITCDALTSISFVAIHGVALTADPTFSTNVVTLAFVDPAATRYGMCVAYGK